MSIKDTNINLRPPELRATKPKKSSMKLYSWNVNGIRAILNKGALQKLVTEHDPDILCLQETKIDESELEKWLVKSQPQGQLFKDPQDVKSTMKTSVKIDFPRLYEHFFSAVKKGYSGTAIFSKMPALKYIDGFPQDIIDKFQVSGDTYGNPNDEGRVIAAEFANFWVVTAYTPNSKDDLSRLELRYKHWDPAVLSYLEALESGQYGAAKPVLYCGDMNVAHREIDLAHPDSNRGKHGFTDKERRGFQAFLDAGFIDTFRAAFPDRAAAYTWWSHWANARANNVGWRIDYWLASASIASKVKNPTIHPDVLGSDHCPVSIEL